MKEAFAIGVDIGGTNTKFGLVNHRGEILARGGFRTDVYAEADSFADTLCTHLQPLIEAYGKNVIVGVGIGAPNGNYYTGSVEYAPNLRWTGIVPLANMMQERLGLPAVLTNDANAAALGEHMYGAAQGMNDFIVITLGTGVGGGVFSNGKLIYGHDGFAGELGHMTVVRNGRKHWATGLRGSLECYASATGIVLTAKELLAGNGESLLRDVRADALSAQSIYEAAIKGDALAAEVYRYTGEILGQALADFVMFTSPEAIILFGGVTKAGSLLLEPVREHMEANLLPIYKNKVKLFISGLGEADAAILGASALVWEDRSLQG
jgi:glucokinase